MNTHEIQPEDIDVQIIMSDHLNRGLIWDYRVGEMHGHDLEIRGHMNSATKTADATFRDLQDKIPRQHLHEIDLHEYDQDLDTAQGARNALAAALNKRVDIGRIPGTFQLTLPLNGRQP